ncbi:probable aspartyl protease At4g16563 [Pistacia vera]|uniref:probable aspartyl protease At4g16563 n=1 Tax=Pistacia vera TaxID=55513 RepID=UPI001262DAD1|nr:probable aspartyl protease At4g16563 [Pistacia vera]
MASLSSFFYLSLFSIFPLIYSLTIPLSPLQTYPSQDPYQYLNFLVSSSLTRAFHLKNPQTISTTPLFSHSYGGYSISLSFGTPPQTIPLLMDTGSDLIWFPCTTRYLCKNCSFSSSNTPLFIPQQSSSSKIIGCRNPKCSWIHPNAQCKDCNPSNNCTQICPPYIIFYESGATSGISLSETLNFPNRTIPNFFVGCSVFSSRTPAGIAGFGRGQASLPSQLNVDKFAYCLLSRKFDDTTRSSPLILDNSSGSDSEKKSSGLIYTPFIKNPVFPGRSAFSVYYYVGLRKITVGERRVRIPYRYLRLDDEGNGGTIIDSGTTFTVMASEVREPLAAEFESQLVKKMNFSRALGVEVLTGLSPCFNVSSGTTRLKFPKLKLHFKGGAEMAVPPENYAAVVGDGSAVCLMVVSGRLGSGGPTIILGNVFWQNYYVEYDLRKERLGFKQQQCE